jgi:hypothetical protein
VLVEERRGTARSVVMGREMKAPIFKRYSGEVMGD